MDLGLLDLRERVVAVVGGDEREQEIARQAVTTGAQVRGYGFPNLSGGIKGVRMTQDPAEALRGAHYALFPIPGISSEGALFAPSSPAAIVPNLELMSLMADGATVILGAANEALKEVASEAGLTLVEYESDQELMLLRGPAIVEGAIGLAIRHTEKTLHASSSIVVGHGNIGRLLARTLVLLGARTKVVARNPVQRADALASGADAYAFGELPALARQADCIFSTVPSRVVGRDVLELLPPHSLVMDLAAPPGGVDLEAAESLGHAAVWARGMGRRAPVTVGRSQWKGIARRIAALEEQRG